jgi:hypothetical protein
MHSLAVVSIKNTSGNIVTRQIISSVAIDTRTSMLHVLSNRKSFLSLVFSSSISSGHSSLFLMNAFVGRPLEQANKPPFS